MIYSVKESEEKNLVCLLEAKQAVRLYKIKEKAMCQKPKIRKLILAAIINKSIF